MLIYDVTYKNALWFQFYSSYIFFMFWLILSPLAFLYSRWHICILIRLGFYDNTKRSSSKNSSDSCINNQSDCSPIHLILKNKTTCLSSGNILTTVFLWCHRIQVESHTNESTTLVLCFRTLLFCFLVLMRKWNECTMNENRSRKHYHYGIIKPLKIKGDSIQGPLPATSHQHTSSKRWEVIVI